MLGRVTIAFCALSALAPVTTTGCSSSSNGSGGVIAALQTASTPAGGSSTSPAAHTPSPASTSSAQKGSAADVDVCSLLTAAQATSLNNVTYSSATPGSPASYYKTCT